MPKRPLIALASALASALAATAPAPLHAATSPPATLHNFTLRGDGGYPEGGLIVRHGTMYGTTSFGSQANAGVVFAIDPSTGHVTALYHFSGGADGAMPVAGLAAIGDTLYGTTYAGGPKGYGTVFSLNPATRQFHVLHGFGGGRDGGNPWSGLIAHGGMLFGTTAGGAGSGKGTVFAIDPASGAETVLYRFSGGADGGAPQASLTMANGKLYGTTYQGGAAGAGTIFAVDPATGAETVLHSFANGGDGAFPAAGLTYRGGTLYGTTKYGGRSGFGAVFSLDAASLQEKVLYSFAGYSGRTSLIYDGAYPVAGVNFVGPMLYGTTSGGIFCKLYSECGTVFRIDPATGNEKLLLGFQSGALGLQPYAGLLHYGDALYGTTSLGGSSIWGTVFRVSLGK